MHKTPPTEKVLAQIQARFFPPSPPDKSFYADRRMLLYAITWPATWLNRRGLPITPQAYENLLRQRLEDIAHHGDPKRYSNYFPRYLLKAIQDPIQFLPEPEFTHRFC